MDQEYSRFADQTNRWLKPKSPSYPGTQAPSYPATMSEIECPYRDVKNPNMDWPYKGSENMVILHSKAHHLETSKEVVKKVEEPPSKKWPRTQSYQRTGGQQWTTTAALM